MLTALFIAFLLFRWVLQTTFAPRATLEGPRDVITATLFVLYVIFLGLAWSSDDLQPATMAILAGAVALRLWALSVLRSAFSYSVSQASAPALITAGPYRWMRNPLLFAYWLELLAFTVSFPFSVGTCMSAAIFAGLMCAWHAHEDNIRFAADSAAYRKYMRSVSNLGLGLFFPSHARLFTGRRFTFDTYAAYAFVGFFAAQVIAIGYGVPMLALVLVVPAAFLGAFSYWRLTSRHSKLRYGFSFFGGMLSATPVAVMVLATTHQLTPSILTGLAIAISLGHAIGRLGCIGHGCCTGEHSSNHHPYYVAYADPNQRINRVHGTNYIYAAPTVLLEALGQWLITIAAFLWSRHAAMIWLVGYGTLRTIIQSIRAEAGDLSRMIPAALLLIAGCMFGGALALDHSPIWNFPDLTDWFLAALLAALVGLGFGMRATPTIA